jgi:hypothetical protein
VHYSLSTLPESMRFKDLVNTLKARWRIEHDDLELKGELAWATTRVATGAAFIITPACALPPMAS